MLAHAVSFYAATVRLIDKSETCHVIYWNKRNQTKDISEREQNELICKFEYIKEDLNGGKFPYRNLIRRILIPSSWVFAKLIHCFASSLLVAFKTNSFDFCIKWKKMLKLITIIIILKM